MKMTLNKTSMLNRLAALVVFGTIVFAAGCDRVTETEGPNLSDIYGEFTVLEDFKTSQADVDFFSQRNSLFYSPFFNDYILDHYN